MLSAKEIRHTFLEFFERKNHHIVPSAPVVIKNDPTLMFTNAGMNQFKDYFLGNKKAPYNRIADTQKCLRVSGKHNDLEEVGVDHYHHTLFEMLGNWSFGDYFKKEAIEWSWELLTEVYKIDKNRLYVSVFEGDASEGLEFDNESYQYWSALIDPSRILKGNKKDNFWEMGDTGPCGPCSEIHVDLRSEEDRKATNGALLVNNDHPEVIEVWNNVFMEFNRKADGSLEKLPSQHVDTGMGFERLTRVLQEKKSNYDTDIFAPIIKEIEKLTGYQYEGLDTKKDIAFRVIADHVRAVAFTIADGQLPSNNGAGYVIRRILRRAIRYGYSYLGIKTPFVYQLLPILNHEFGTVFPELKAQESFISRVIQEEENTFLKTLSIGLEKISIYLAKQPEQLNAETAFELYDTFGFPIDLTQLICSESGISVDLDGFQVLLNEQRKRSQKDAEKSTGDWHYLLDDDHEEFIGYDFTEATVKIVKYRTMTIKNKEQFQLVFNVTPFYGESGGQVGDNGTMTGVVNDELIQILDTQKENDLIVHLCDKLPENKNQSFSVKVDLKKRQLTSNNHSATHLLHAALKQVLGSHIAQKGSLVNDEYLRFDFNHFAKVSEEELATIEAIVNSKIQENIDLNEQRMVPIKVATEQLGATALFGEKYGDTVRVITFDKQYSIELCGGTHVKNTGQIRSFKIISESSVAAGVRRIEAISAEKVDELNLNNELLINKIKAQLGQPKDLESAINKLIEEKKELLHQVESLEAEKGQQIKSQLKQLISPKNNIPFLAANVGEISGEQIKNICFQLRQEHESILGILAFTNNNKPNLAVFCSDNLVQNQQINCQKIIKDLATHIQGGGGGQAFYATAGGKLLSGIPSAIEAAKNLTI
jgi:alanyl-tRNA synthetase